MILIYRLRAFVRWMLGRRRVERQLRDEIEDFIERSVSEKVVDGMPPEDAWRLARIELGGVRRFRSMFAAGVWAPAWNPSGRTSGSRSET